MPPVWPQNRRDVASGPVIHDFATAMTTVRGGEHKCTVVARSMMLPGYRTRIQTYKTHQPATPWFRPSNLLAPGDPRVLMACLSSGTRNSVGMSQIMLVVISACVAGPALVAGQLVDDGNASGDDSSVDESFVCTEPTVGESFVAELVLPDGTTTDLDHPHRCVGRPCALQRAGTHDHSPCIYASRNPPVDDMLPSCVGGAAWGRPFERRAAVPAAAHIVSSAA